MRPWKYFLPVLKSKEERQEMNPTLRQLTSKSLLLSYQRMTQKISANAKAQKRGNISFFGKDFPQAGPFHTLLQDGFKAPVLVFTFSLWGGFHLPPPSLPSLSCSPGSPDSGSTGEVPGMKHQDNYLIILAAQTPPDPLFWASKFPRA